MVYRYDQMLESRTECVFRMCQQTLPSFLSCFPECVLQIVGSPNVTEKTLLHYHCNHCIAESQEDYGTLWTKYIRSLVPSTLEEEGHPGTPSAQMNSQITVISSSSLTVAVLRQALF